MYKTKRLAPKLMALLLALLLVISAMPMSVFAAAPAAIPSQIAMSIGGGAAEGNSAVGFNWVTDTSVTTSEIIYGTSPTLEGGTAKSATMTTPVATGSIPDNAMANFKAINSFKVTIQDLTPETKYYYKVGDSTNGYSAIASFTAPADPDGNKPFSFVVSADTQGASVDSFANTGALYNYIKANEPDAAFLLHTGDVVDDASKSDLYQYFFDSAQNLLNTLPIMASPGNHDGTSYDEFSIQFKARFNYSSLHKPDGLTAVDGTVYSFEYGDALFICLNSFASSADDAIQWQFLADECAATTKAWKIVYFHNATYDPGSSHYQLDNVSGKKLTDAGVDLVFNGHEHAYARTTLKTTGITADVSNVQKANFGEAPTYVIGGSVYDYAYSKDTRDTSWNDFFYDLRIEKTGTGGGAIYSPGVYGKVDVTSNALIYKAYYKATGSANPFMVIDTFTIKKSGSEITQPKGLGTAPTSVTFLFDSFKQEAGKYIARFNWVTPVTTKATELYYAKKEVFDSNGGMFTDFIVGKSNTVDNSSALAKAGYNGMGTAYSVEAVQSHKAETTVLDPGTEYVYCVGDGSANVTAPVSFKTPASGLNTFNFTAFSDMQQNGSSYAETLGSYTANGRKILDQALADYPDAAFILSSGDNVNYGFDTWEWDAFFAANADIFARNPFYTSTGNHEYEGSGNSWAPNSSWDTVDPTEQSLLGRYNPPANGASYYGGGNGTERMVAGMDKMKYASTNYYFVYGDTLFMMLDYQDLSTDAQIKQQQDWMKSVVKQNPTKWRVAVMHKSIFGYRMTTPIASWTAAYDAAGVDVVLMGHDHIYVRTKLYANGANIDPQTYGNGTTYITNYSANDDRRGTSYSKDPANVGYVDVRSIGPGYSNISISPTEIRVTSKGFDTTGTLQNGDSNALVTDTPRTPNLAAWTYPAVPQDSNGLTVTAVTVAGIAKEGQTLSATITPPSATASFKWESSPDLAIWTAIAGETKSSYTIKTADVGLYLRCTATGSGFYDGAATSSPTAKVTPLAGGGTVVKIGTAAQLRALAAGYGTPAYPIDGKYELTADIDMNTIEIGTADELAALSAGFGTSAYPADGRYELTADIDMNNVAFSSIGAGSPPTPFTGTFNGKGYTISNLKITSSSSCTGLFSYIATGGRVVNVKLTNADITGGGSTGAIAGASTGTVENCSVEGKVTGGGYTGAIVGTLHAGTLQNCIANVAVSGGAGVGLIGGTNYNGSGSPVKVREITPGTGNVILNNYILGTTAGTSYTGSFVGDMGGGSGCLLKNFNGNIAASTVNAAAPGVIAGYWSSSRTIINMDPVPVNYYDSTKLGASGLPAAIAPVFAGKTAEELAQKATFEALGWDFTNVWDWDAANNIPVPRVISVADVPPFMAIGAGAAPIPFLGTFDGKGFTISNLKISSTISCTGLFAYISTGGRVANVRLANVDITGVGSTGAIAGASTGTIENCSVDGKVTGGGYTGGIVGTLHAGTLQNCFVNATVSCFTGGGLIGGTNFSGSGSPIKTREYTAGTGNVIVNNYVISTLTGTDTSSGKYYGAFIGDMGGSSGCYLKMFDGNVVTGTVNGAASGGKVSGYWSSGRPIENVTQATVNYYDSEKLTTASGISNPTGVAAFVGKTAADFAQKSTFEALGWDFTTIWDWDETNSVPVPRVISIAGDSLVTVIATSGTGGTISPTGYVLVQSGSSQKFTFTPNNYFVIDTVKIDGVDNTAAAVAGEYTFDNVTAVHTIDVTFKLGDNVTGVAPSFVSTSAYYNRAVEKHIDLTVDFGQGALGILDDFRHCVSSAKIMKNGALVFDCASCFWFPGAAYGYDPTTFEICWDDMIKQPAYANLVPGTYDLVVTFKDLNSTVCTIPLLVEDRVVSELAVTGGTIMVDGNAAISPTQVKADSQITVTATVPNGQGFVKWVATGLANASYTENPFTFTMPSGQVSLTAEFAVIHTITASAGANGAISPAGAVVVNDGQDQTFTFTPDYGYVIDKVMLDGSPVVAIGSSYTIGNITADHTISVTFKAAVRHIINAKAVGQGSISTEDDVSVISPDGNVSVIDGEDLTFIITPDHGYMINKVTIDGKEVAVTGNRYTFKGVNKYHTIKVSFKADPNHK